LNEKGELVSLVRACSAGEDAYVVSATNGERAVAQPGARVGPPEIHVRRLEARL
jgi:hypothetical protein